MPAKGADRKLAAILVPRHSGFDELRLAEDREVLGINQQFDASGDAGFALDEAGAFEGEHHLVNRWRGDAEVPLQVGFGWWPAEDAAIGIDEGEVLALLFGEGGKRQSQTPNN
jgi:hypothetical protein